MNQDSWVALRETLHAEWTKLRTLSGTRWLLIGVVALTVALSAAAVSAVHCTAVGCHEDPAKISLTGVEFGQAVVAVLAVLAIGDEYSNGLIRVTLAAMPRRSTVLAAKAIVVGGLVLIAGTCAVALSMLVGRIVLPGNGFTAAHGYASLSLGDGPVLRAAIESVLYLTLIALLSLGLATVLRDSAAAIGTVLGLLYLFPIIGGVFSDPVWHRHLEQIGPLTAGLAAQTTVDLAAQPIGPWAGLGVVALWAAGALFFGGVLLRVRDA